MLYSRSTHWEGMYTNETFYYFSELAFDHNYSKLHEVLDPA